MGGWHRLHGSKGIDPAGKLNANPSLRANELVQGDDELIAKCYGGDC